MKVTIIEGADIVEEEVPVFSIDGIIDFYDIDREDLERAKENKYMDSAEAVVEEFTTKHHIITYFDFDGAPTFFIKNR